MPLTAVEFQAAAIARGVRSWLGSLEGFEIHFRHAVPTDGSAYREAFRDARLCFDADHDAIVFPEHLFDWPLPGADAALHQVLIRQAEQKLAELPQSDLFWARVSDLVLEMLPHGTPTTSEVGRELGMSRRTLARRLEEEGVTFRTILDQARHGLAQQYLERTRLSASEVAARLGFSSVSAFSRAFARWQGSTVNHFRRSRQRPLLE